MKITDVYLVLERMWVSEAERTQELREAIQMGVDFLLSRDPVKADYPYVGRVSSTWFKFGFPLSYWSDVLETASVLTNLGYGADPGLQKTMEFILGKQDGQGRWKLENTMNRMWFEVEEKREPSKWTTLRALRVLKGAGGQQ